MVTAASRYVAIQRRMGLCVCGWVCVYEMRGGYEGLYRDDE